MENNLEGLDNDRRSDVSNKNNVYKDDLDRSQNLNRNKNFTHEDDLASSLTDNPEGMDARVNTNIPSSAKEGESLTIQEDMSTDPNKVANKPSFTQKENK